ncbi:unnamed protein product, partial [Amoebophrya sp. A25]|eukprot:GSA25T00025259001.1
MRTSTSPLAFQNLLTSARVRKPIFGGTADACELQYRALFEMPEELAAYLRDVQELLRSAYEKREFFRTTGGATVDSLDFVLHVLKQRLPQHVPLRDRLIQTAFELGLIESLGIDESFTERKRAQIRTERV